MPFLNNIPQPGDNLDFSQPQLLGNNQQLDTSFGVDHYEFSDGSGQTGKHNRVTTPVFVDNPPTGLPPVTISTEPQLYAFQQTAPFGVLQYSRGWQVAAAQSAVPSPVTTVQSQAAAISVGPGNTCYIMDFTGLTCAIATVYFSDFTPGFIANALIRGVVTVFWDGTGFFIPTQAGMNVIVQRTGNILQLRNTTAGVTYLLKFTMVMQRMQ